MAAEHGLRTIAFPAISTGVYGYPASLAAQEAVAEIRQTVAALDIDEVLLVTFGPESTSAFQSAVDS